MPRPLIYADFNNADALGRTRLNCVGTVGDLSRMGIELRDGLPVTLYDEELEADGEAQFSNEEHVWVASINWLMVRQKHT